MGHRKRGSSQVQGGWGVLLCSSLLCSAHTVVKSQVHCVTTPSHAARAGHGIWDMGVDSERCSHSRESETVLVLVVVVVVVPPVGQITRTIC
ncbi:GL16620 [Drosophila persimilis]|uniref:GL16620 n=1 Tax=Drosophila persimilis TaxID=7234 RepID=B4IS11_DROPE|nr:GL16620 [Drosophila persimilis]